MTRRNDFDPHSLANAKLVIKKETTGDNQQKMQPVLYIYELTEVLAKR